MTKMIQSNMFTFAVLFILVPVVCTQECSTCQCCADGKFPKCSSRDNCNNGCIEGYYGKKCKHKCTSQICLRCHQKFGHICLKCTSGYYLYNHNCFYCGTQCKSCASNGCNACYDGNWGNTCGTQCAQNCASCSKWNGYCLSCESGYYVYNGKCTTCGIYCALCGPRGCTFCHDGYWGSSCDNKCAQNCASCRISDGYCLFCASGYFFHRGKCTTCGIDCGVCGPRGCTSCHDGYWGNTCDENCAQNCASCRKSDGYCLSCDTGYYVYNGECTTCGTHCAVCGKIGCTWCHDGYWGNTCDTKCVHKCASCSISDGYCLSCVPGYWGKTCNKRCVEFCSQCDKLNGDCHSCDIGRWGYQCTECLPGYYNLNHICEECQLKPNGCTCTSSVRCSGCVDGYFFNDHICSKCPDYCPSCKLLSLSSPSLCTSCASGMFGQSCQYRCSENCKNGICEEENAVCRCSWKFTGETCEQCTNGRFGEKCEHQCSLGCESGNCMRETGFCSCKSGWSGRRCETCMNDYYGEYCNYNCDPHCVSCVGKLDCQSCIPGKYGNECQSTCPAGCLKDICDISDGSCDSCIHGHYGKHCNHSCPNLCYTCDQRGHCTACKPGFSNLRKQCTCRIDVCNNESECTSCNTPSFFVDHGVCCPCDLSECVSCSKTNVAVKCNICNDRFYPSKHGQCIKCNSNCIENACNSSSGKCLRGCKDGFWKESCDKECGPECLSCNQADGSCSQCKNNSKYGPYCNSDCKTTCNNSLCYINGDCIDGCVNNYFGNQCENRCDEHCISTAGSTICSERTGMCLYGCELRYKGVFCPEVIETNVKQQTSSAAALVWGVGGGVVALTVIVVVGLLLLRTRKNKFRTKIKSPAKESENLSALYATVNKRRAFSAENANDDTDDTDNVHSVTIEISTYQNPSLKSSRKEETPILTHNLNIDADDVSARAVTPMFETNEGVYFNNAKIVRKCKLMVVDLPEYVQNICIKDLEEEFQKIPYGLVKPYEVSQTKLNMHRNRYKGIYPYDDTRVVVRGGDTDYINASYIDGFRKRNAYIAALGPMAKQLGDFAQFWRMVWQQKVEKIVMVTNLVECEKTKCEQYWPDHGQRNLYGDIEVVFKVEKLYADFIWRQFTFSKSKQNSEKRILHHLQFTAWPDKDIPDNVTSIIEFRQKVNALPSSFDGPVIVHCSAGVGRTGTYIALDILTKEGEEEGAIDIPGCVLNMRQNRPSMIQTLSQYKFLHQALVHSLTLDCSLIQRANFHEYMHMMSSKQEIQKQFQKMQINQEQKSDQELQAMEKNRLLIKKNRKHADIPAAVVARSLIDHPPSYVCPNSVPAFDEETLKFSVCSHDLHYLYCALLGDANRPRLYLFLKPGESDYINAIYIDSFKTKNRFLVAQTPLPDTVSDFIALIVQENCSCIVSMEAQGIGLYVPGDDQSMMKGVITILSTRDQSTKHFVKRELHFKQDGTTKSEVRIPHYEYLDWDRNHNTPKSSAEHFVAFIKEVEDASKSSHIDGPILVHCMNGAGKSGLLCVVSTLLETLSEDNEVSVVNAVRKVRANRPLSIPNKEQFYFCYECVLQSLNATDDAVYYNTGANIQRE